MTNTEALPAKDKLIDHLPTNVSLNFMLENQFQAFKVIKKQLNQIEHAISEMYSVLNKKDDGRIIYAGAGTSARIAVQDGVELFPTFSWPQKKLAFVIAGGIKALTNSIENSEDNVENAKKQIKLLNVKKGDVLIGLAASGETPFTLEAVSRARKNGALTIGISNNVDTNLEILSEIPIVLNTGNEALAGSTRLKAGTAQKICLNLISTMLMVKFGKVKNGMMVDMQASNKKLLKRQLFIKNNMI